MNVLNNEFFPTALELVGSLEKFTQLLILKTYLVDLEGLEVQLNVVSA